MNSGEPVKTLLGFAQKAGKVVSGETSVEIAVRRGRAQMIIVAGNAAENTKAAFRRLAASAAITLVEFGDKTILGQCIGKGERAVIAITDVNFCNAIRRLLRPGGDVEGE